MKVLVKKLHEDSIIPTFGSVDAAGADLYAHLDGVDHIAIAPHHTVKVGTGIAVAVPSGYWGGVYARSGIATKQGLRPANAVGVVDADYRGEVVVALHNDSTKPRVIHHGDRIAQFIITPVPEITYEEAADLDDTERGYGGFGHTGV